MRKEILKALSDIEKAFIIYYGEDNYARYHNLFREVYKNMMSSSHKTKKDYQNYLESHALEIYQWQLKAERIVEDVKTNIR